jgi:hypothetical protein
MSCHEFAEERKEKEQQLDLPNYTHLIPRPQVIYERFHMQASN